MSGVLVRLPDDKWLRHEQPNMPSISGKLAQRDAAAQPIPHKPFRTEPHLDLIQTEEDAENFAKFLRRRNEREAKRRAKLGLDAA
jgi:hypothetical protein